MITIHSYRVWDPRRGEYAVPLGKKSTVERIKQIGGEIIPGTAEEAEVEAVGAQGGHATLGSDRVSRPSYLQAQQPTTEPSTRQTVPRKPLFRSNEPRDKLPHYEA